MQTLQLVTSLATQQTELVPEIFRFHRSQKLLGELIGTSRFLEQLANILMYQK